MPARAALAVRLLAVACGPRERAPRFDAHRVPCEV